MDSNLFCQSCSTPIDYTGIRGSEKDGSRNNEYCLFCYRNGKFIDPQITLDEMKNRIRSEMEQNNMPDGTIQIVLDTLPFLKRWNRKSGE